MPYYDDTLTRSGAEGLAQRLDDYWHARGWPLARHWIEPFKERSDANPLYGVRSNLMNGQPPLRTDPECDEDGRPMPSRSTMRKAWADFRR